MKETVNGIIVFLLVLGVFSCAQTETQQAAKVMLVAQDAIVNVAREADRMCSAGVLTQRQCDEIGVAYSRARIHYDLAEAALSTAIQADSESAWENYRIVHESFERIYSDLLVLAYSYGIEKGVTQ